MGGRIRHDVAASCLPAARFAALAALAALCRLLLLPPLAAQSHDVLLATTTSTRDAGLLDSLLPVFERQTHYTVKVIAVGSGRALVDSGYFVGRRIVMHNEFLIVGPARDPAGLRGLSDPVAAFRKVAERRGIFVSRGDQSGTHQREQLLWKRAGFPSPPRGKWYIESGQGMGATLQLADEKHGYTLTDRATYLTWRDKLQLFPMVEGDSLLYNVYHVLELNPKNASRINVVGGKALADFLVAPETQRLIGEYGKSRFGQSLFVPDAGKEPSR